MSMNDQNEPSYYEIALTNRQVMMAFVVVLAAVLGAFVCGVWAGKRGTNQLQAQDLVAGNTSGEANSGSGKDDLENFKFFTEPAPGENNNEGNEDAGKNDAGKNDAGDLDKPDLSQLLDKPDAATTLAQDVGHGSNDRQTPRQETRPPKTPPPSPPPTRTTPPPPPPKVTPPPPRATPPASSAAAATEGYIVQVFSSQEEPKAKKILGDLEGAGYKGFIVASKKGNTNIYRVRIGPYSQKASADRAARGIRGKFKLETWVTAASN